MVKIATLAEDLTLDLNIPVRQLTNVCNFSCMGASELLWHLNTHLHTHTHTILNEIKLFISLSNNTVFNNVILEFHRAINSSKS